MADAAYIDIEKLKVRPKLSPSDFPTRKAALDYAEARLDELTSHISDLEQKVEQATLFADKRSIEIELESSHPFRGYVRSGRI